MNRILGSFGIVLCLALGMTFLWGCAEESDGEKMTDVQEVEEYRTLRVMWWGDQSREESTKAVAKLFEETHPGVKVEVESTDWAGYMTKLSTKAISGELPDVMQQNTNNIYQYYKNGLVENLTPYLENGTLDMSDVAETTLRSAEFSGGIYAIPAGINAQVLAYRQDVLDECGLEMPEVLTWSEFLRMSEIIHEKTGRQIHAVASVSVSSLSDYLQSHGMSLYNEAGDGLGFDDPMILVKRMKECQEAIRKGYTPGVGEVGQNSDIFDKEVWASNAHSNSIAGLEEAGKCTLSWCPKPWMDGAEYPSSTTSPTVYWAVGSTSKVKDLAVEFIDFYTNEIAVYDIVGTDRGVPISSKVAEYLEGKAEGNVKRDFEIVAYMSQEGMAKPIEPIRVTVNEEIKQNLEQMSERVLFGVVTDLEKEAEEWMEWANQLLKEASAQDD